MTKIHKSVGDRIFDSFNVIFILIFSFIMVYPFINQMALSLNEGADASRGGIYFLPRKFTLANYQYMLQNTNLARTAVMSVLRVLVGTSTCLLCTGLLSYVVTVQSFSGRRFLRMVFLITMYFGGGLIPFYLLIVRLHLLETFTIYWLPSLVAPYYMLIIASYMQNLPESLSESARLDGASELLIFFRIIVPISLPVFASIAIFSGVGHWNSWFDSLLYNPSGKFDTLQVILRKLLLQVELLQDLQSEQLASQKYRSLTPATARAATAMIVTIPIILIYPFLQRYFITGITLGAVKG
ncbi:MAG: carbohydrate ABC transporter permease [Clostridiales bacterium]|nr:carbohydrate ABC transporter permease [Clostridiales bacterium]